MAYKSERLDRLFVVRWLSTPDLADTARLRQELARRHAEAGTLLVNLSVVSVGVDAPSGEARAAMSKVNDDWQRHASAVHVVIEGEGFKTAIVRSVISAMNFATGKRGFVRIHATLTPALATIAADLRLSPAELRDKLERLGMLHDATAPWISAAP